MRQRGWLSGARMAAIIAAGVACVTAAWPAEARFRGGPKAVCGSFWLFETGYAARISSSKLRDSGWSSLGGETGLIPANGSRHTFTLDIGGMRNLGDQWAVGATTVYDLATTVYGWGKIGVKPRVRRWLNAKSALDFSAGAYVIGSECLDYYPSHSMVMDAEAIYPGWLIETSLDYSDYVILTARYEIQRWQYAGTDRSLYLGVKLGSYAGVVSAGAGLVLYGVAAIAMSQTY